ncbi:MAG: ABC transporter ATP-binding protein [Armatimonadota bacterium]|nr:ABC transporter ATP-binding protein [Armatimonadota bacterium]MDR7519591.1 ABC transporter ATP-binding protein [Armatimonadota bacterium]MDR7549060.1 ABC transporter ATP-binding protein [Armatimonadota bacterium]
MGAVELRNVSKHFGPVRAVDDVSLTVNPGEFLSLLGPSGCGKTTTLRLIAGFEPVTAGRIFIAGQDVTDWPPYRRNIGMVFQHYALFPHMTVRENVAFGLRMRRLPAAEIAERVERALALLRLTGLGDRYQRQLSGGQQQRVALARALVIEPQILLLDEPLSNLDAKLREEMRVELKQIQQQVGITTIFVTHDQEEALIMSDRVAVMNHGKIVQQGTPIEVYERPAHSFVAGFIGQSNLLWGQVVGHENGLTRIAADDGLVLHARPDASMAPGSRVLAVIKQSRVKIAPAGAEGTNAFAASLEFVTYLGATVQYLCRVGQARLAVSVPHDTITPVFRPGERVTVSWRPEDCLVLKE